MRLQSETKISSRRNYIGYNETIFYRKESCEQAVQEESPGHRRSSDAGTGRNSDRSKRVPAPSVQQVASPRESARVLFLFFSI
jgi:hypothetical protein